MHIVLIGIGGFVGAIGRYLVDGWISSLARNTFPFGTMAVNVSGSLMAGLLITVERVEIVTYRGRSDR